MMCHLSRTTATISIDPNGPCHSSSIFQLAFIGLVPDGVGLSFLDERYAYLSSSQDPSTLADISGSNRPP